MGPPTAYRILARPAISAARRRTLSTASPARVRPAPTMLLQQQQQTAVQPTTGRLWHGTRSICRRLQTRRFFETSSLSSASAASAAVPEPRDEAVAEALQNWPARITIEDINARRRRDGRLVAGTAAVADVDSFKTAPNWRQLPKARSWDHLLSRESAAREPCMLKQAAKHLKKPGLISLGGGLPSPEIFPIESLSMRVPTDFSGKAAAAGEIDSGMTTITMGKYDASQPVGATRSSGSGSGLADEYDLSIALNYGQSAGSPQMLRWVTEHTELVCRPPYADWRVCLTVGSTGALEQALRIFCDRERGDSMLTETFSFSTALETAAPLGIRAVGVAMDEQGLLPEKLDNLLSTWDVRARGGAPKPHLLYTVPTGQNPTGATQGAARRQAIYDVCRRHDVYILEDEPYYYVQMSPYAGRHHPATATVAAAAAAPLPSPDELLQSLIPSYVSIDVDGRVMRMDSFSKVLVPGSRMGWITASEQIVERFMRHGEACNQGPSGFSQAALYKLLDQTWGHAGYLQWLARLRDSYTRRRNILLDACEDHLPAGIVTWDPPVAGMFHWLKIDHTRHPDHGKRTILEIEEEIFNLCIASGVLVARGSWFVAEPDQPLAGLYFRATYAAASADAMKEAIRRFGDAVRQSFRL
ncbi:aromatic aminotransferase [Niveomyces insectorum RCEF 264]|uniref:aromatic-amino-acid transaminase n=1 Tax=Niveomyces insectorum RCEF 264 TaxID=1081102 RepID=A0A167MTR2_9HYPO|nr:aromatic aminotransferase [Niveomyces insectorum RCEF 264]